MRLTPRLQVIADYVKKNSIVADIGTDHGYIPVYLIEADICDRVIATDINKGPLENAESYIKKKGFDNNIDTRLGDGLCSIKPNEVDTLIIAGMGGLLMIEILEKSKDVAKSTHNFILQPMVASDELRRYLCNNGYRIVDEKLAKESDKIYEIIYAKHGKENIEKDIYFEIGKKLIENKDQYLSEFIRRKIDKLEKILSNLEDKDSANGKERYEDIKIKYNDLQEVYNSIC